MQSRFEFLLLLAATSGCTTPLVQHPEPTSMTSACVQATCAITFEIKSNNTNIRQVAAVANGVTYTLQQNANAQWVLPWTKFAGMNGDIVVHYRFGYPSTVTLRTGTYQVPVIYKFADTDADNLSDRIDGCPFVPGPSSQPNCTALLAGRIGVSMDGLAGGFFTVAHDNTGPEMFTTNGQTIWAFNYLDEARQKLSETSLNWAGKTAVPKVAQISRCKMIWSDDALGVDGKFIEVYAADFGNPCTFQMVRLDGNGETVLFTGDKVLVYVVNDVEGPGQGTAKAYARVRLLPPPANAPAEGTGLYSLLRSGNKYTNYIYFTLDNFVSAADVPSGQSSNATATFKGTGQLGFRIPQ